MEKTMHYTIYKITNKTNGKIYIGSHKTKDLNDNYMGSGTYLRNSQEKYGIENFSKEILFVFDNPKDMYDKEAELVNEDFLAEENTYNLKLGGFGGWDYFNKTGDLAQRNIEINSRKDYTKMVKNGHFDRISKMGCDKLQELVAQHGGAWWESSGFTGKTHTDDAKNKIGYANSISQIGDGNSQFGTIWITDGIVNKKIKKLDPISEGWKRGRVLNKR